MNLEGSKSVSTMDEPLPSMTPEQVMEMLINVDTEPTVISNKLIYEAIERQEERFKVEDPEADNVRRRLLMDVRIPVKKPIPPLDVLKELNLEYFNILKIDHLWMCTSLTTLTLSNNIIEKIENLDELVNLVELNFSFNRVQVIENLSHLQKLERLSLFSNRIEKLQHLEDLKRLQILSIGYNEIKGAKQVLHYLRKFKRLRSLNLEGNPCTEEVEDMRLAVAAFIPQLVYYNYRIFQREERLQARRLYRAPLKVIEAKELKEKEKAEVDKKVNRRIKYLRRSLIDGFEKNEFYDRLMENDDEGPALVKASDRVKEVYYKFKEGLYAISVKLFKAGDAAHKKRMYEIRQFAVFYEKNMVESMRQSRVYVRDFINKKTKYLNAIIEIYTHAQGNEKLIRDGMKQIILLDKDFILLRRRTWWLLMDQEMRRYERNEDSLNRFENTMVDQVNKFVDFIQEQFTQIRDLETEFCDSLQDQSNRFIAELQLQGDNLAGLPLNLRKILLNKENLNNYIATSHDNHLSIIDNKEESMLSRLRTWMKTLLADFNKKETKRNRDCILEIQEFLGHKIDEWVFQTKSYLKDAITYMTKVEPKWTNDIMRLKMTRKERMLDDKMQLLLTQRRVFDRRERIRRDKLRKARKEREAQKRLEEEERAAEERPRDSPPSTSSAEGPTVDERRRALAKYRKEIKDIEDVFKQSYDIPLIDEDEPVPGEHVEAPESSVGPIQWNGSKRTGLLIFNVESPKQISSKSEREMSHGPLEIESEEESLEESESYKDVPLGEFPESKSSDEEASWSQGSAILVEDEQDIEEFRLEVSRNVQKFINNLKIKTDHMADTIWETWSSPEPDLVDNKDLDSI